MKGTTVTRGPADSRDALLAAATAEFALHGFDGASVDTIARRARVNKAMIYYHFRSKAGLYLEILRAIFTSMGERTAAIAAADLPPSRKIAEFVRAISLEADARPHLAPMMMREIAEGARRLDAGTLRLMSRLFANLRDILQAGAREGAFRPVNPLLTYFSLISPIIFFRASLPVRDAMGRHNLIDGVKALDNEQFLAHLTATLLHALAPDAAAPASPDPDRPRGTARRPPRPTRRSTSPSRSGEHA